MNTFNQTISDIGIVPVIKLSHPERDAAPLAKALISHGNVQTVVLTGATMEKIRKAMLEEPGFAASGIELICKPDFEEAVRCAARSARPGDAVLLSPACASFDAFANFEKRGERFSEIVNSL